MLEPTMEDTRGRGHGPPKHFEFLF